MFHTPRLIRPLVYLIGVLSCSLWIILLLGPNRLVVPLIGPPRERSAASIPIILQWNMFFDHYRIPEDGVKECPYHGNIQCYVTHDRQFLRESDAILFHVRNLWLWDLPRWRAANQKWVFWNYESPFFSDISDYSSLANLFNWTFTYRTDSDVFSPYSSYVPYNDNNDKEAVARRWTHIKERLLKRFQSKSRDVAWMVSHCGVPSNRDAYAAELAQHLSVDIYGKCGVRECPLTHQNKDCMRKFEDEYFFYLSFENSLCKDYLTEKLFWALKYDMIPIILGGINVTGLAPQNSYIDASKFKSPKDLSNYLLKVKSDFKYYSKYFRWKRFFTIRPQIEDFCELCHALHKPKAVETSTTYKDMEDFWVTKAECKAWSQTDMAFVPIELPK